MRRAAPRRAIGRRPRLAQGVTASLVGTLFTGLAVYGLSQATQATATPIQAVPAAAMSAAPVVSVRGTDADSADQISEDAKLISDLEARQIALDESEKSVSAELAKLVTLGKFYYPTQGDLGSPWGMRFHPILHVWKMHEGVDIGAACEAPIWSVLPGTVLSAGNGGGAGNYVKIDHGMVGGKHFITESMHMTKTLVKEGQVVERGQQIGLVGSTGLSTVCHLHLALWVDGANVDPAPFIKA